MEEKSNRLFLRKKTKRSTPVTADEIAARNRFAAISRGVQARRKDLTKIVQDQQAFRAQKDNPNGYKTFYSYLWNVVVNQLNG